MKVKFSADEWYPVYTVVSDDNSWSNADGSVELTEAELAEFQDLHAKFEAWQKRLRDVLRGY